MLFTQPANIKLLMESCIKLSILGKHNIKIIYLGTLFQKIEINAKYLSRLQSKCIRKKTHLLFPVDAAA